MFIANFLQCLVIGESINCDIVDSQINKQVSSILTFLAIVTGAHSTNTLLI